MSSLRELEGIVGIDIVTPLAKMHTKVMATAGMTLSKNKQQKLAACETKTECLEFVIDQWKSGGTYPQTWESLLHVLDKLNLLDQSHQIENFFSK